VIYKSLLVERISPAAEDIGPEAQAAVDSAAQTISHPAAPEDKWIGRRWRWGGPTASNNIDPAAQDAVDSAAQDASDFAVHEAVDSEAHDAADPAAQGAVDSAAQIVIYPVAQGDDLIGTASCSTVSNNIDPAAQDVFRLRSTDRGTCRSDFCPAPAPGIVDPAAHKPPTLQYRNLSSLQHKAKRGRPCSKLKIIHPAAN
jgi:hypothetical protein